VETLQMDSSDGEQRNHAVHWQWNLSSRIWTERSGKTSPTRLRSTC